MDFKHRGTMKCHIIKFPKPVMEEVVQTINVFQHITYHTRIEFAREQTLNNKSISWEIGAIKQRWKKYPDP